MCVSVTSVSHVLNNTRHVSPGARQRIVAAISQLGYIPSAVARSLKHNHTRTLGMLIPSNANPYFADIIRGMENQCFASGYNLILCNSDNNPDKQASHLKVLAEKRIDGLILVASGVEQQLAAQLQKLNIPLVLVDRDITGLTYDLIQVDHVAGSEMATTHLINLGHRFIACISGPAGLSPNTQRRAGWKQALAKAGLPRREGDVARGDFTSKGGYQAMQTLLGRSPRPSAVFVCNDVMAIGALRAAQEAGLPVPGALSIVGFDDIDLASYTTPPLTRIAQPRHALGMESTALLLERINGKQHPFRRLIMTPELKLRESTSVMSNAS